MPRTYPPRQATYQVNLHLGAEDHEALETVCRATGERTIELIRRLLRQEAERLLAERGPAVEEANRD